MRNAPCIGILLASFAGHAVAGSFQDLAVAAGKGTALSHNGRIAAGIAGQTGWRWAKDRGVAPLTGFTSVHGMTSWAQPIAGQYASGTSIDTAVAALAFSNSDLVGGPLVVGAFPGGGAGQGGGLSEAYGVSDNGIAVGLAFDAANTPFAFRWTAAEGMTRLPLNRPTASSRANGISADGTTIVGWNDQADGTRTGVIWRNGAALDLIDAQGRPVGEAQAANRDGSVVVGEGATAPDGSRTAWRWTAATGVQALPQPIAPGIATTTPSANAPLPAFRSAFAQSKLDEATGAAPASLAFSVSDDGDVIVGRGGAAPQVFATIWTPSTGTLALADYAAAHGVAISQGWTLSSASAVSADGKTILGWGSSNTGPGSFLIDLHDAPPAEAILVAHGSVDFNSLSSGPFAGVPGGTPVTMSFHLMRDGAVELEPAEDTRYPIRLDTFSLIAGTASDTLVQTEFGPGVELTNDYPLSDGIHLMSSPMATPGQMLEFELFNPGGDMFDSDDLERINRRFDASFFEKAAWSVSQGDEVMTILLQDVAIDDVSPSSDTIFENGFD